MECFATSKEGRGLGLEDSVKDSEIKQELDKLRMITGLNKAP